MPKKEIAKINDNQDSVLVKEGKIDNLTSRMADIVFDNIVKIDQDKGYINQADAISRQIDTLIDVAAFHIKQSKNIEDYMPNSDDED